jgi:hypothetical protein
MFQNRRQATLGNINLGSLSKPPTYEDMSFLVEQAARYRGRFVEVSWHVDKTGATFQLTTKYITNQPQPVWMLYRGIGGSSELIWGHNSNDLTLMHNLVMLECEKPVDGGNSISAGAMDNLMNTNRNSGSVASGPDAGPTTPPPIPTAQRPAAGPAPAAASGNPAATWLQNVSQSQSAGSNPPTANTPEKVMD